MKLIERLSSSKYEAPFRYLYQRFQEGVSSFIMWNSPHHNDHGLGHIQRVIEYLDKLASPVLESMSPVEAFVLLAAAVFHDVGLMLDRFENQKLTLSEIRDKHHMLSQQFIKDNHAFFGIDNSHVADFVADIAFCHRRRVNIADVFRSTEPVSLLEGSIRPRRLSALLRLADALDCDSRRAPEIISDQLLKHYPDDLPHWQACQLISGVSVDHNAGLIVIDTRYETQEEEELLSWKLTNIYQELESVRDILIASQGPYLWDITGRLTHTKTGSFGEMSIKSCIEQRKEAQQVNSEKRKEFFARSLTIWEKVSCSPQELIQESIGLYKDYKRFPFAQEEIPCLVYPSWVSEVKYSRGGKCKVEYHFVVINISDESLDSCTHPMSGVVPMTDEKVAPECFDLTMDRRCEIEFIETSSTQKRIRYWFQPILTGQQREFRLTHFWDYPLPLFGLRWNRITIGRFVVKYEHRFIYPRGCKISQMQLYKDAYPWTREVEGVKMVEKPVPAVIFKKDLTPADSIYNINVLLVER